MWQFLYFLPLPHQHGSFRPSLVPVAVAATGAFAGSAFCGFPPGGFCALASARPLLTVDAPPLVAS